MIEKRAETATFDLLIAGDYGRALEICERFCLDGFCVSVFRADYVYTMGREEGVCVRIINYPRFPSSEMELEGKAKSLGLLLMEGLNQGSFSIVGPRETVFVSRRKKDGFDG